MLIIIIIIIIIISTSSSSNSIVVAVALYIRTVYFMPPVSYCPLGIALKLKDKWKCYIIQKLSK
jgi:hypothetical protein